MFLGWEESYFSQLIGLDMHHFGTVATYNLKYENPSVYITYYDITSGYEEAMTKGF